MRHFFSPGAGGGVSVIFTPRVCRIVNALPISQVSLPLSRSMTKRRPVPEVRARFFCVTPSLLRVSRIRWPICSAVYLTLTSKCYRTVTLAHLAQQFKVNVTVREYFDVTRGKHLKMFPYGNIGPATTEF